MKKHKLLQILFISSAVLLGGCAGADGGSAERSSVQQSEDSLPRTEKSEEERQNEDSLSRAKEDEAERQREDSEKESQTGSDAAEAQAGASAGIAFVGKDIEGNTVSSLIFSESRLTMVNVWATYCNPCLREMPGLGELAAEYDSQEFQLIGIVSDVLEGSGQEALELAADLIEQTGADYPHLLLNESLYNALLADVTAVPTTFFIDENGEILDTVVGSMEKSAWEEKIDALLAEL